MSRKPNTKGLTPFKKGESGNPNGRPKKLPQLDALLAEVLGEDKDGITAAQAILMALRKKAAGGDVRAAEVLLDRAWGKAKQSIDMTTGGENFNQIKVEVIYEDLPAKTQKTSPEPNTDTSNGEAV